MRHNSPSHARCPTKAGERINPGVGVELISRPPQDEERQGQTFRADRTVSDADRLVVAGCTLRVIHTPGPASNQCCHLLEEDQQMFTGDHIMQGSTAVVIPPDGNMTACMAAPRKLQGEPLQWLAPGHGFLIGRPQTAIERLIAHRIGHETKVMEALRFLGNPDLDVQVARL